MGWLSDWWYKDDPLGAMDPSLRQYLEKEAPKKYKPAPGPTVEPQTYREQLGLTGHNDPNAQMKELDAAKRGAGKLRPDRPLPRESKFQDGRYKDLWATYRPQAEINEEGKSDQERLNDIVQAYKERQANTKEAAMQNCADEQFNLHDCFRNGGWSSRMTMCRAENKAFNKCVMMQIRFLRALGYSSLYERTDEESESIQMHADRLYQRMLGQERLIAEAKEKGEAPPSLPPLMTFEVEGAKRGLPLHSKAPNVLTIDDLPKELRLKMEKDRFANLEGPQLELAKKLFEEELALNQDMIKRIKERWIIDRKERLKRLARGEETLSDKVMRVFDMRTYPDDDD